MFKSTPSSRNRSRDRAEALGDLQTAVQAPFVTVGQWSKELWAELALKPTTAAALALGFIAYILAAHWLVSLLPV